MAEWILLILLLVMVGVPVVLLFGFSGCDKVFGLDYIEPDPQPEGPMIASATGTGLTVITLRWVIDPAAVSIAFERTELDATKQPVGPPYEFTVGATLPEHPDSGLRPSTTYRYVAYGVYADGERSLASAPVDGTTLAPPTFDAVAAGTGSGGEAATADWSHTTTAEAAVVIVGLGWAQSGNLLSGGGTPTRTVTYGAMPMESLGVIGLNDAPLTSINGTFVFHEFFGLRAPPGGPQTVSASVTRNNATSITVEGCSVSYRTVRDFGPVSMVAGSEAGTALTQNVTSAEHETVVQMFTTRSGGITGYSQTPRYDSASADIDMIIGDAQGDITVAFTAIRGSGVDYAGLAVRLLPIN